MGNFQEVIDRYRKAAATKREQGTYFEDLTRAYLTTEPAYRELLRADHRLTIVLHNLAHGLVRKSVKNTGGRNAGSITAAQFLQRFVNKVPWAHLDVAGTAMDSVRNTINQSWGSGWGVRLLNRLVEKHYEG